MTDLRLLYVTCKDASAATLLSSALLERRLAACTNCLPQMTSTYWWQGAIEISHECVLIVKTQAALVSAATALIEELHSYDTPCVLELPVLSGAAGYLSYVTDILKKETPSDEQIRTR